MARHMDRHVHDVFLIDDDQAARRALARLLPAFGLNVVGEASDACQALNLIHSNSIDLILTDLEMPGMSGLDFVKAARELGIGVPIIVLSGGADDRAVADVLEAGANCFLSKPLELRLLSDALRILAPNIARAA